MVSLVMYLYRGNRNFQRLNGSGGNPTRLIQAFTKELLLHLIQAVVFCKFGCTQQQSCTHKV